MEHAALFGPVAGKPVGNQAFTGVVHDDVAPLAPFDSMDGGEFHAAVGFVAREHGVEPAFKSRRVGVQVRDSVKGGKIVGMRRAIGLAS